MKNKITILLMLFVIALLCSSTASAGYLLILNPTTGKLDYVSDGNFTAGSTFTNISVTNTATIVNLILTNLESNVDGTGFNITAHNFVGNLTGTANSSSYWDNLDDPTDITSLGTISSATSITTTAGIVTNLEATNLELNLDGTAFNITAHNFVGNLTGTANSSSYWDNLDDPTDITALGTVSSATSITTTAAVVTNLEATNLESDLDGTGFNVTFENVTATAATATNLYATNMEANMDGTGFNVTVDCIIFDSGGTICSG